MRQRPKSLKPKAKLPVAPKSPKNQSSRARDLEKRLAESSKREAEALGKLQARDRELVEAHEQQTATSEILHVISSSPTDLLPALNAVAASAARVCQAYDASIFRVDEGGVRLVAHQGPIASLPIGFVLRLVRETVVGRSVLDRRIIHLHDVQQEQEEFPEAVAVARRLGSRTTLAAPLLREGVAVGAILIRRTEVAPFSPKQIALLETFADQAVIAIENVRLFTELQASNRELTTALDTQTATSDILRVISHSQRDVQPVFDAIVHSAVRLLRARSGTLSRIVGDQIELAAHTSTDDAGDAATRAAFPQPLSFGGVHAQTIRNRAPLNIADAQTDPRLPEATHTYAQVRGYRSQGAVPMLRHDEAVGAIAVTRREPGGFTEDEIALLQTFADQAVIAIENVRLFKELQARNQELTVALAQQTATSEVLAVISGAQTDVQPVFEAIVQSARRLCDASYSSVYRLDGQLVHLVAHNHQTPEAAETFRSAWPMPLSGDSFVVRAIRENAVIHTDMQEDPTTSAALLTRAKAVGHRRILVVPMVREGQPIGGIRVSRAEATSFAEHHIALLQTFADQAVIAIENVRLFKELEASNREIEEKSRQIEVASQHKSEFLANMSHELRTPLNAIIGFSEVLSERMFGDLNEKQEEYSKDIHASGQHLLSLINDILDLSKIEAGRMELELSDFHLPTALDSALTLVRERAGRRSIALHLSVDERLGQIQGDERKVRQVVLNLLSNAIKFTPEGGRIEVAATPKDGLVEVSVSDTGVGIAPEDQEKVFEEFRQVGTADKKAEGTGLGLTLCRKFIELHGGKIWVKSEPGLGSTFTFTIPVHRGE